MKNFVFVAKLLSRRYPVWFGLILVCLTIFGVPSLRSIFRLQTSLDSLVSPSPPWSNSDWPKQFFVANLIENWPDDRNVQIANAEDDVNGIQYRPLLKQHPNDALFLAAQLRKQYLDTERIDRTFNGTRVPNASAPSAPPAPFGAFASPTPNLPDATEEHEIQSAIKIAQRGRKVEPNNIYFDGMAMYALFCAGRDEEALRVLDVSLHKTKYDDHVLQAIAATIRAREKVRPLSPEEKQAFIARFTFDHLARLRTATRGALYHALKYEGHGNHRRALSLRRGIAHFGRLVMEQGTFNITSMVGRSQLSASWYWPKKAGFINTTLYASHPSVEEFALQRQQIVDKFKRYATRHGRRDFAAEAQQNCDAAVASYRAERRRAESEDSELLSKRLRLLNTFGFAALMQMMMALALAFVASFFLRRTAVIEVRDKTFVVVALSSTIALGGFVLTLFFNSQPATAFDEDYFLAVLGGWGIYGFAAFFLSAGVIVPMVAIHFVLRKKASSADAFAMPSSIKLSPSRHHFNTLLRVLLWCGVFYSTLYLLIAFISRHWLNGSWILKLGMLGELDFYRPEDNLVPHVIAIIFYVVLLRLWELMWFEPHRVWRINYFLRLCRQSWFCFLLISSVFWLLFAVVSLPERARSEHKIAMMLQHGETWMAMR